MDVLHRHHRWAVRMVYAQFFVVVGFVSSLAQWAIFGEGGMSVYTVAVFGCLLLPVAILGIVGPVWFEEINKALSQRGLPIPEHKDMATTVRSKSKAMAFWIALALASPWISRATVPFVKGWSTEMNINWLVVPTLLIALLLFVVGQRSVRRCRSRTGQLGLSALWFLLGVPGFLLPLYYLHWFDDAKWFYEFRSLPYTELTAAASGLFAGALYECGKGRKLFSRPFFIAVLVLGIIAPHLKPVLTPVASRRFRDRWQDDTCMQSTPSSCGAASATTVFRTLGVSLSEKDIAKECFTSLSGTENWYIVRAFRHRGYRVTYRIEKRFPSNLKTPAIAGVRLGGVGHFIAIVDKIDRTYATGDPLVGREEIPADEMIDKYDFTGFFIEIQKEAQGVVANVGHKKRSP